MTSAERGRRTHPGSPGLTGHPPAYGEHLTGHRTRPNSPALTGHLSTRGERLTTGVANPDRDDSPPQMFRWIAVAIVSRVACGF